MLQFAVIKSFAHGGLKRFFESGAMKGIPQDMFKLSVGEAREVNLEDYH